MIVYSLLFVTLLLAFASFIALWKATGKDIRYGWPGLLLSVSLAGFIYLFGTWVFISVYLKYVFAAFFTIALLYRLIKGKAPGTAANRSKKAVSLVVAVLLVTLCILYFTGTTGKPYGVARLAFPFKNGTYLVFQGGKGLPTNIFHFALRGAVYAMDIVKLNSTGNRANRIFSSRLEDYATFGDTIYSPCNGRVMHTRDENPDNMPPGMKRGPSNTNHVLLETDSFYVFMGHMRQHCVFVHEGDTVVQGEPLGCAGNSGFSLEPHLHIQVQARQNPDLPWYKQPPLLIGFDGRSYLLFEEIKAPVR